MIKRVLITLFASALIVDAQSDRGTITGQILDGTGAAVPNAQVTAVNSATQVRYQTASNDTGTYVIPQLPSGGYEVTVQAAGFRRTTQRGITIAVLQTVNLSITLELGEVEQTIDVVADAPAVETATSDLGTTVSRDQVVDRSEERRVG